MGYMIKKESAKLVVLVFITLLMTLFELSSYVFINQTIKIVWNLIFIIAVVQSSLLSRHVINKWTIRFYFISYILIAVLTAILPGIISYLHLLSLLVGLLFYPYKKYPVVKRIITVLPILFFSFMLMAFLLISSTKFTSTTVILEVENNISYETLVLEFHDLGATGGNYSLVMQKSIIDNVLIFKSTQIRYLERKPEDITWVDRDTYSIDGAEYRLK